MRFAKIRGDSRWAFSCFHIRPYPLCCIWLTLTHSSAPVPFFVNFVGGLDAESGRPQLSKPKVCELVLFGVGGRGRVIYGDRPTNSSHFRVFVVFSWISCDGSAHSNNPVHEPHTKSPLPNPDPPRFHTKTTPQKKNTPIPAVFPSKHTHPI